MAKNPRYQTIKSYLAVRFNPAGNNIILRQFETKEINRLLEEEKNPFYFLVLAVIQLIIL